MSIPTNSTDLHNSTTPQLHNSMTTQQHIDGLITTIWHATEDRSVSNIMVARVLDWLNRRALRLQEEIGNGHSECVKEFERVNKAISDLTDLVKGVNTLAGSAYGRADTNTRAIERLAAYVQGILLYLDTGKYPDDWDGDALDIFGVKDVDRGEWKEGEIYYNGVPSDCDGVLERSHVWFMGCKFVCLRAFTRHPPRWNSPDWRFEEGDPKLKLRWTGSEDSVYEEDPRISLEVEASLYNQDLTAEDSIRWDWSRESWRDGLRDSVNDGIWNDDHANCGLNALDLEKKDMNFQFGKRPDKLIYTVTATLMVSDGISRQQRMVFEL